MTSAVLKQDELIVKLREIGFDVRKVDTAEKLQNRSWIMTSRDRKGMIKIKTKK